MLKINRRSLVPGRCYEFSFTCRDIGYGVEEGIIEGYWTGEIDVWGKLTIIGVNGDPTLYLFADEINWFDQTDTLSPLLKARLRVGF